MNMPTAPATPQVRKLAAEFQRVGADLAAAMLPGLPPKKKAAIDACRGAGATLRLMCTVDGLMATRVVMEMMGVDGMTTKEMASVFVDQPDRR